MRKINGNQSLPYLSKNVQTLTIIIRHNLNKNSLNSTWVLTFSSLSFDSIIFISFCIFYGSKTIINLQRFTRSIKLYDFVFEYNESEIRKLCIYTDGFFVYLLSTVRTIFVTSVVLFL